MFKLCLQKIWNLSRLVTCSSSSWWRGADGDEEVRGQQMEQMSESTLRENKPPTLLLLAASCSRLRLWRQTAAGLQEGRLCGPHEPAESQRDTEHLRKIKKKVLGSTICSQLCFFIHIFYIFFTQLLFSWHNLNTFIVQLFFHTFFITRQFYLCFFSVIDHLLFALFTLYFTWFIS